MFINIRYHCGHFNKNKLGNSDFVSKIYHFLQSGRFEVKVSLNSKCSHLAEKLSNIFEFAQSKSYGA